MTLPGKSYSRYVCSERCVTVLWMLGTCVCITGCFSERSIPLRSNDVVWLEPAASSRVDAKVTTREWVRTAHADLRELLPARRREALLTEDLTDSDGRAIDVAGHFGFDPSRLHTILHNLRGLEYTAQASGGDDFSEVPLWDGFEAIWVPVGEGIELAARLGLARNERGEPLEAHCVVVLGGLFADNSVTRTRDICQALRKSGIHALALEQRGCGLTDVRFPEVYHTFNVLEVGDLLAVDEFLQSRPYVLETGLVGFCWGANAGLMAAWEDNRSEDDPAISASLQPFLRARNELQHFRAGIVACSPVLRYEETVEKTQQDWAFLRDPVHATLQDTIAARAAFKQHPTLTRSLRTLIEYEFARSPLLYPRAVEDALDFIRLLPFRDKPAYPKLELARVPVLILYAANDPLGPSQHVADMFARVDNPQVAALMLPDGGHIGFVPFARRYFYSLLINFFDADRGPFAQQLER